MTEHTAAREEENRLNGGSNAKGVGGYLLHRAKPHLPPWLAVGAIGVAGATGHFQWGNSVGAGVGLTLASVALTGATWWAGRSTNSQRRVHSVATVAAGTSWVTAASLAGPFAGPLLDLYLMGGPVLAASWNVRMIMGRGSDSESTDKGLLEKVGLAKARLGTAEVEPNRVTVPYALPAGEGTHQDAVKALPNIASALDVPTSAVRHQPDPDSARRGQFVIVPEDMLKAVTWYPGPSAPGGSIADPLVIGVYDDGSPLLLTLPEAIHLLIMGMTGSGKTEGAIDALVEILTRRDVAVWLSDPKRGQDLGEAFPGCDWVAQTAAESEIMIAAFQEAVTARQGWLGQHGYRSWTPEAATKQTSPVHSCADTGACGCPGMPYLVGWFEEAASTLRAMDDDAFTGIAQEARSAGASLVVSMQRASGYQISTDTRASLPASLCFGVEERDASFALPDEVLDAGANPGAWKNRKPGYCYLVAAGIDESRYASPGRTFRNDPVALEWAVREFASIRMGADPVTAQAAAAVAGVAYTTRNQTTEETADVAVPGDETNGLGIDPEDAHIDPEAELPEVELGDDQPMFAADKGHKPSPDEARELFAQALEEFERAGQMIVGPKDFMDWCERHGYSRPWISARLKDAAQDGRLEQTAQAGRWRIRPTLTPA